jgi:hypothetical protein
MGNKATNNKTALDIRRRGLALHFYIITVPKLSLETRRVFPRFSHGGLRDKVFFAITHVWVIAKKN